MVEKIYAYTSCEICKKETRCDKSTDILYEIAGYQFNLCENCYNQIVINHKNWNDRHTKLGGEII